MRIHDYRFYDFLHDIKGHPGLYGLYAVPGAGKSSMFMYISDFYARNIEGNPLVFSMQRTEEEWRNSMGDRGLCAEGVTVIDSPAPTIKDIEHCISEYSPSIVMIDMLSLIDDSDVIRSLAEIAKEREITIILAINLARNCGDADPVYRRPQLFDLVWVNRHNEKTVMEFLHDLKLYSAILFLHRNHDCERGIGTVDRYNFCEMAELSVYEDFAWAPPVFSIFQILTKNAR